MPGAEPEPLVQCTTSWPDTPPQLTPNMPVGITPAHPAIGVIGLDAELDWFVQIHSD